MIDSMSKTTLSSWRLQKFSFLVIFHCAMSLLQKKLFSSKGLPPRPPGPFARPQAKKKDFSPVPWSTYFDSEHKILFEQDSNAFHYYRKGDSGPIILFLHGGGFSGLSWALLSKYLTTFVHCQCIAVDQRGHGVTTTEDDLNLTADQLASDVGQIVTSLLQNGTNSNTPVIVVGHSMGGAVAIHAAAKNKIQNLSGLIVIDVVEGSALDSLHGMHGVLKNRPKSFESIEKANEWCIRTGYVRNAESARVSMSGQLKKLDHPIEVPTRHHSDSGSTTNGLASGMGPISEEEPSAALTTTSSASTSEEHIKIPTKTHHYEWRIDLSKTSKHWEGWFRGMTSLFLSVEAPKLLLLAGIDRLDAQMTTAQMQGKFQMQVIAKSGHAVHEDAPDKVAEVIAGFLIRHQFSEAIGNFKRPMPAC